MGLITKLKNGYHGVKSYVKDKKEKYDVHRAEKALKHSVEEAKKHQATIDKMDIPSKFYTYTKLKAKDHWKEHKNKYYIGAAGAGALGAGLAVGHIAGRQHSDYDEDLD